MKQASAVTNMPLERRRPPPIAYISLLLAGLLISTAVASLYDYAALWSNREVMRITSPDGLVDAVLLMPVIHRRDSKISLHIVPRGEPIDLSDAMLHGSSFQRWPKIEWDQSHLLLVTYDSGCINDLTNLWHSPSVNGGQYYVELRAVAGSEFPCLGEKPTVALETR